MLELKPERLNVGEFSEQPLSICGRAFVADVSGALYWPGENALIVADLHCDAGPAVTPAGAFPPASGARGTLSRLAEVIDRYDAATVICLGAADPRSMTSDDQETLGIMQEDREWIWVTSESEVPEIIGGHVLDRLDVADMVLSHGSATGPVTHEICGRLKPAARISYYGHVIRRPCFAGNGLRLILPAFGSYAGGTNVLDAAFEPLFGNGGFAVWVLGQEGLYPVATRLLKED
jgi:hypothetical protein